MKDDYEKVNYMLDEAINKVLIETTDRFNIPDGDPFKEPVCDPSQTEMRFESYDPDDMKHINKRQVESRPHYRSGYGPPPNVRYSYDTKDDDEHTARPNDYERPTIHNRDKYAHRNLEEDSYGYNNRSANYDPEHKYKSHSDYESNQSSSSNNGRESDEDRYKTRGEKPFRKYESSSRPREVPASDEEFSEPRAKTSYETRRESRNRYSRPESDQSDRRSKSPEPKEESSEENDPASITAEKIEKLRNALPVVVARNEWGALPPMKDLKRMEAPAESFVLTVNSNTPECHEPKECVRRVREIQARHMGEGLGDIQYNFLVGGDGKMYEGRGWLYESGLSREEGEGINYNIAFIGNFEDTSRIPSKMLGPVQDLVVHAKLNKLVVGNKVIKDVNPPKKE